jgi:hypothetical protein
VVIICTTSLTSNNSTFCPHSVLFSTPVFLLPLSYRQMPWRCQRFQVAAECFSRIPPDLYLSKWSRLASYLNESRIVRLSMNEKPNCKEVITQPLKHSRCVFSVTVVGRSWLQMNEFDRMWYTYSYCYNGRRPVSVVTSLQTGRWKNRGLIPGKGGKTYFLNYHVCNVSGHTHSLNQLVPAALAFGLQRPGHEADCSSPLHFTSLHVATNSVCAVTPAHPETTPLRRGPSFAMSVPLQHRQRIYMLCMSPVIYTEHWVIVVCNRHWRSSLWAKKWGFMYN